MGSTVDVNRGSRTNFIMKVLLFLVVFHIAFSYSQLCDPTSVYCRMCLAQIKSPSAKICTTWTVGKIHTFNIETTMNVIMTNVQQTIGYENVFLPDCQIVPKGFRKETDIWYCNNADINAYHTIGLTDGLDAHFSDARKNLYSGATRDHSVAICKNQMLQVVGKQVGMQESLSSIEH